MWEFLSKLLDHGGIVAVSFAALGLVGAAMVRALWSQNQSLHEELRMLQEKRIGEAKRVTESVLTHVRADADATSNLANLVEGMMWQGGRYGRKR